MLKDPNHRSLYQANPAPDLMEPAFSPVLINRNQTIRPPPGLALAPRVVCFPLGHYPAPLRSL